MLRPSNHEDVSPSQSLCIFARLLLDVKASHHANRVGSGPVSLESWAALALESWSLGAMGLGPWRSKSQDSVSEASGLGEVPGLPGWVADCDMN